MDADPGARVSAAAVLATRSNGRDRSNRFGRHDRLTSCLAACPLFASLDEVALRKLARQTQLQRYRGRCVASAAGAKGDGLSLVCSGSFKVCSPESHGRQAILALLGPGDFFGELCTLSSPPGRVSVVALRHSEVATVPRAVFAALLEDHPAAMAALLTAAAGRVRSAEATRRRLAMEDVPGRVADTLRQLAAADGEPHEEGVVIRRRPSQALLAGLAGSTRETVSRVHKDLEARRLIECDGRRVLVRANGHRQAMV